MPRDRKPEFNASTCENGDLGGREAHSPPVEFVRRDELGDDRIPPSAQLRDVMLGRRSDLIR